MVALGLLVGLAVMVYLGRDELSPARIVDNERQLRAAIAARPWYSFAIGFSVYAMVSVLPGATGKAAVAGWLFGFWPGLVMVLGGLTLAGVAGFAVARLLLRDSLRGWLGLRLIRFDQLLHREGSFYLLTLRLLHVPFTLVNYLSGVSGVKLWTFIWTTVVGLVPGTVVLVGLGARLPSLQELIERGPLAVLDPVVIGALAATALIPWALRVGLARHRGRSRAVGEG